MLRAVYPARSQCSRIPWTLSCIATLSRTVPVAFCRYQSTVPPSTGNGPSSSKATSSGTVPPPPPSSSSSISASRQGPTPHKPPTLGTPEAYARNPDLARYISDLNKHTDAPDLMVTDPLLDPAIEYVIPPNKKTPYENKIILRNNPSLFEGYDKIVEELGEPEEELPREESEGSGFDLLPYNTSELRSLHRYPLVVRRVSQQTGKGKIHRMATIVIVGNGDGLVGFGMGKHEDAPVANDKAFLEAVKNMDYVDRFEGRTIWTELSVKFGGTHVILRPRPVGFGLHCNPYIHQILKAAGIKDCSAKVWGSRNPVNVIMATFKLLHAGNAPLGMGDGIGGRGRRMEKSIGMRSAEDVERERGRKLTCLRTV